MKPDYAKIIEWRQFESPSSVRPYGLIMEGLDVLSDETRGKMIQIAISLIGPMPKLDESMAGRWTTVHNCKTWAFDTEGARAAFVMATKGDASAL